MTTITIALCQEDRARLDKIIEALEQSGAMAATPSVTQEAQQSEPAGEPISAPEESSTAQETVEEPAKVVPLADIQKKVVELSAAGKKAEVRDIITKYAGRVSAIPEEHTAAVWEQLIGLEG